MLAIRMDASYQKVLSNWDVGPIQSVEPFTTDKYRCSGSVLFLTTPAGRFVLKRIAGRTSPDPLFALLPALSTYGVPVAVPLPTKHGQIAHFDNGDCYYLAPYLPGEVILDHFGLGALERSVSFGAALANLHKGLKEATHAMALPDMDLLGQVLECQAGAEMRASSCEELSTLGETVKAFQAMGPLPTQVIHRDSHASNVLFETDQVSGWLDFELTTTGPRVFDLCYYSTSLLMDALYDSTKRAAWLEVLRNLVHGYESVEPLTEAEHRLLPYVLLSVEAIFTSYCVSINDQAAASKNIDALLWIKESLPSILVVSKSQSG